MYQFIKQAGISIPLKYEKEPWMATIKGFLTRQSRTYGSQDQVEIQEYYVKTNNNIIIPRFFPIKDFVDCEVIDKSHDGEYIDIEHNINPKNELQERAIEYLRNNDRGTIELQPGTGKTVISIYDICERKRRPLILVYLHSLSKQWKDRFLEHTNLNENDILQVTSSNFKKMKDHKILIITNQTFLSLLKNKPLDFLYEINQANIGIFISDEAHTSIGANTFSRCSINIPAKVVRGLSATPYRFDGNSDIIEYHTGPVFSDDSYEGTNTNVECTFILFDFGIDKPSRSKYLYWNGEFNRARYLSLMAKEKNCPRFHNVIKELLKKFKDKDSLIILERNKLVDGLYNWLDTDSKARFNRSEGLDKLEYKTVFSTPNKIRDGIDAPWKELVLLTSPISNIKQMTGRVCREYKNKDKVMIIDLVDIGCYHIAKSMLYRKKFYKNNNWKVKFLTVDLDGNINSISESEAKRLVEIKK